MPILINFVEFCSFHRLNKREVQLKNLNHVLQFNYFKEKIILFSFPLVAGAPAPTRPRASQDGRQRLCPALPWQRSRAHPCSRAMTPLTCCPLWRERARRVPVVGSRVPASAEGNLWTADQKWPRFWSDQAIKAAPPETLHGAAGLWSETPRGLRRRQQTYFFWVSLSEPLAPLGERSSLLGALEEEFSPLWANVFTPRTTVLACCCVVTASWLVYQAGNLLLGVSSWLSLLLC